MTLEEMEKFSSSLKRNDVKYPSNLTDYFGERIEFTTLGELVSFLSSEYKFWFEKLSNIPNQNSGLLSQIKNTSLNHIKKFIQGAENAVSNEQKTNLISQLQRLYKSELISLGQKWIQRNDTSVDIILEINEKYNNNILDTFLSILKNPDQNHPINNSNQLIAFFEYYKFKGYESNGLFDFAKSSEESINQIRSELRESSNQLFESIRIKHQDIDQYFQDQIEQFEKEKESQATQHEKQASGQSSKFDGKMEEWQQRAKEFEEEYKEKLRFKGPAQYWQQAANTHIFWSMTWGTFLLMIIVFGLMEISVFFKIWLQGKELPVQLDTLQGAALLLAFASAYAFIISVLAKLTLSSVHLYRDAREREQLTHLYLSLANKTDFDNETRKIVLQSLFSRSDSGLLGKDGGVPVMPVIDIFKKN
ncbi:DUF6161 domain-containing protein [Thiomicrospira sp. WB1]|uniref:DUF6161 domain-containing protein n=1 Tax=Thiomicrospira sp. WB1 TaxID=1685380 RepID=UPI0007481433|nr:DUF6161 domain-containing protein [Thiomicrospira sp. WB1]KUJ71663.1 hypothetical protein AVO41_09115 [Thiomicrospira sp. WB1]